MRQVHPSPCIAHPTLYTIRPTPYTLIPGYARPLFKQQPHCLPTRVPHPTLLPPIIKCWGLELFAATARFCCTTRKKNSASRCVSNSPSWPGVGSQRATRPRLQHASACGSKLSGTHLLSTADRSRLDNSRSDSRTLQASVIS